MRAAEDHCHGAFISSLLDSHDLKLAILRRSSEESPLRVTEELLQRLAVKTGGEVTIAGLQGSTQRELSTRIDVNNTQNFLAYTRDSGSTRDMARLNSLGLDKAGAWLNVIPSPTLGLHLKSPEFIVCVKYRHLVYVFSLLSL